MHRPTHMFILLIFALHIYSPPHTHKHTHTPSTHTPTHTHTHTHTHTRTHTHTHTHTPVSHRQHCPSLITINEDDLMGKPKSQLSLLLRSRKGFRRTSHKNSHGADPSWLHPILMPSIFQTLLALYNEHNWEENKKTNERVSLLGERGDEELCRILGIQGSVILCALCN